MKKREYLERERERESKSETRREYNISQASNAISFACDLHRVSECDGKYRHWPEIGEHEVEYSQSVLLANGEMRGEVSSHVGATDHNYILEHYGSPTGGLCGGRK